MSKFNSRRRDSRHEFREGFSLGHFLGAPLRRLRRHRSIHDSHAGPVVEQTMGRAVLNVLFWPFVALGNFIVFLVTVWSVSRSGRAFLWSMPALLAAAGLIGTVALAEYRSRLTTNKYRFWTQRALSLEDYQMAKFTMRRVMHEMPEDELWRFQYARVLLETKEDHDEEEAMKILQALAPTNQPGLPAAHLWFAEHYGAKADRSSDPREYLELMEPHLRFVLSVEPQNVQANTMYALIMRSRGLADKEMEHMERAAVQSPATAYQFAITLRDRGQIARSNHVLDRAIRTISDRAMLHPNDLRMWQLLLQCHMVREDYRAASATLQQAMQLVTEPQLQQQLQIMLSELFVHISTQHQQVEEDEKFRHQFNMLSLAVAVNPQNRQAMANMVMLMLMPDDWDNGKIDEDIRRIALDMNMPAITHLMLGARQVARGEVTAGRNHVKIANEHSPVSVLLWTHLSNILGGIEGGSPEAAIEMVNVGIDQWPSFVGLHMVRGNVLIRLERTREAVRDFEFVAEREPENWQVREILAQCFEQLNDHAAARQQREHIERIRRNQQTVPVSTERAGI